MADQIYPGELATPQQIRALADEYRKAAAALTKLGRAGKPLTRAPFRLVAIHAIELYLSALLLHQGYTPSEVRALQHDLGARADFARRGGLALRELTFKHLADLAESREYLITRYGPELVASASPINRLTATLDEVAKKVAAAMAKPPPLPAAQPDNCAPLMPSSPAQVALRRPRPKAIGAFP